MLTDRFRSASKSSLAIGFLGPERAIFFTGIDPDVTRSGAHRFQLGSGSDASVLSLRSHG